MRCIFRKVLRGGVFVDLCPTVKIWRDGLAGKAVRPCWRQEEVVPMTENTHEALVARQFGTRASAYVASAVHAEALPFSDGSFDFVFRRYGNRRSPGRRRKADQVTLYVPP